MNVRFTDEETAALRAQAEVEHRSMGDVARAAVREYVARRRDLADVTAISRRGVDRFGGALWRLGEL